MSLDKIDKSVTVVFDVNNWGVFQSQWGILCDAMRDKKEMNGAVISGVSRFDEMSRVEQLEALLKENGIDIPERE